MSPAPSPGYGTVDMDVVARLAGTPPEDDGPVWMVNLMSYRDVATYADDRGETISGREADDRYAPLDILDEIGAEIVLVADVDTRLLGDDVSWDRIAIVRYPTGRSFVDMQSRADFRERHVHKEAGMAKTFVLACRPTADVPDADVEPPDWAGVAHPPTDDDPPVIVMHLIAWADGGRETMRGYEAEAAAVAVPHGVRIGGWFDVEGSVVGDGRRWDEVRFNRFPSREAFMAVATDPRRLAAQGSNREPAMTDTYTMILRPTSDALPGLDRQFTT